MRSSDACSSGSIAPLGEASLLEAPLLFSSLAMPSSVGLPSGAKKQVRQCHASSRGRKSILAKVSASFVRRSSNVGPELGSSSPVAPFGSSTRSAVWTLPQGPSAPIGMTATPSLRR